MKITKEILTQVFDILWDRADKIMKEKNPCGHKCVNGGHSCLGSDFYKTYNGKYRHSVCCGNCPRWDNGCKANKPLGCRMFLCSNARSSPELTEAQKKLDGIASVADCFYLARCYMDKDEAISHALYNNTLLRKINDDVSKQIEFLKENNISFS